MMIKIVIFIVLSFFSIELSAQMTEREQQILSEINSVRKSPASYIKFIDEYLGTFKPGNEDLKAAAELKKELLNTPPLTPLQFSPELYESARKHASNVIRTGEFEHSDCECGENIQYGIDNPRYAVIELLIDSGIAGRGHRKNILNPQYKYAAIYEIVDDIPHMNNFIIQQFQFDK